MIFALLEYGTIWFWLATIIPFLLLILFVETESAGAAIATIIVTFAAFLLFGNKGIITWISENPITILQYAGGYIAAGIVWGFVKWFFYVLRTRDRYEKFRKNWISENGDIDSRSYIDKNDSRSKAPTTHREQFQKEAHRFGVLPPKADYNKGRIIFWMTYWPASAVWTIINDPITRMWKVIYNRIGSIFEHMSSSMFSKYQDDFKN